MAPRAQRTHAQTHENATNAHSATCGYPKALGLATLLGHAAQNPYLQPYVRGVVCVCACVRDCDCLLLAGRLNALEPVEKRTPPPPHKKKDQRERRV